MPPRLPLCRALGCTSIASSSSSGATPSILRPFSSTQPTAAPRDHNPRHASPTSSSARLLNINRPVPTSTSTSGAGGAAASGPRRGEAASRLINRYEERMESSSRDRQAQVEYLRAQKESQDYQRFLARKWAPGEVYSPRDLSPSEMAKWRRRSSRKSDVVDALGLRPVDMYKNFSLIAEFTTASAQIKPRSETQLRPVNQRKIAKMIRRVQGMGLYPTIHEHPEMLRAAFFPHRH